MPVLILSTKPYALINHVVYRKAHSNPTIPKHVYDVNPCGRVWSISNSLYVSRIILPAIFLCIPSLFALVYPLGMGGFEHPVKVALCRVTFADRLVL